MKIAPHQWGFLFLSLQIILELSFVYTQIVNMRKWFKKNESLLTKLGAIFFVLSFIDLFLIQDNIIPVLLVIWLFYSVYKQRELFK